MVVKAQSFLQTLFSQEKVSIKEINTHNKKFGLLYGEYKAYIGNAYFLENNQKLFDSIPAIYREYKNGFIIYKVTAYRMDVYNDDPSVYIFYLYLFDSDNSYRQSEGEEIRNYGIDDNGFYIDYKTFQIDDAEEAIELFKELYAELSRKNE